MRRKLTGSARVVRLNKGGSDLAILDLESIALASGASKESSSFVKSHVQSLGELSSGVGNEANLVNGQHDDDLAVVCAVANGLTPDCSTGSS